MCFTALAALSAHVLASYNSFDLNNVCFETQLLLTTLSCESTDTNFECISYEPAHLFIVCWTGIAFVCATPQNGRFEGCGCPSDLRRSLSRTHDEHQDEHDRRDEHQSMMRMHAFRSALTTAQRQLSSQQQRAFAVAAAATPVPVLSAQEWMDNIKRSAEKDVLIKKTKLASFLKTVTTSEELEASKEIMKIYEQKRVDPDSNAAGLFVKKALELNAANVAFEVLEANYRIGLFLEPSTLNKLLSKFFKDGDFDKVFQLHEIGSQKYKVKSTERTYDILIRYVHDRSAVHCIVLLVLLRDSVNVWTTITHTRVCAWRLQCCD